MCWNFESSILSFFIGIIISNLYIKRNRPFDTTMAYLIGFYSFIQLFEAILWKSLTNKTVFGFDSYIVNLFTTQLIYYCLFTHVIGLSFGIYLESNYTNYIPLLVGFIIFLYALYKKPKIMKKSHPTDTSNGHIVWGFDPYNYPIIMIASILLVLQFTELKYSYIGILFYLLTFMFSKITNTEAVASYWCWISAFLSFIPLLITYKL